MAKIKISDLAFELGCEGKELRVEFYSQPPRSVREYQAVNRRAHTGEPQPWKKAFSTQSTANAHSDVEKPNRMLMMPVAISPIPIK